MNRYETVIGLEIHAELRCASKIFCSCSTAFGGAPNTQVCPVCLGHPGALPTLNREAVRLAVRAGLATGCEIRLFSAFDRKNYFYPDLPKGYQITQFFRPICEGGALTAETPAGPRRVGITRIHLEEDAGKLIHTGAETEIDCNRCGVPLIEIVTAPDLRGAEDTRAFVEELRDTLRAAGVTDGRMQEGSLRVDVNLSVHRPGEPLGTRTEMKNLNSFSFIARAVEFESRRQIALLERGEAVIQETRRFDERTGETYPLRRKETAADYRFFPEPDLPPLLLTEGEMEAIRAELPELPAARRARLRAQGIPAPDAAILARSASLCDWFDRANVDGAHARRIANLLLNELLADAEGEEFAPPFAAERLAAVAAMLDAGEINAPTAKRLLARLREADFDPAEAVDREGLRLISDPAALREGILSTLSDCAKLLADYDAGKTAAANAILGRAMGHFGGRADPVALRRLLDEILKERHRS